jgi:hypothetical protein
VTAQLTAADLTRLTAERKHNEIEQARTEGRLDALLGVPPEQIALLDRARNGRVDVTDVQALAALRRHDLIDEARATDRITYDDSGA